jgi:hypothetical protein
MPPRANITVTTGPDRGRSCALSGELMRVGRSPENDLVLTDPDLADHLASIVERDGRYAIITTVPGGMEIDGTEIPVERWVWLPEEAQIKVSRRTMLAFTLNGRAPSISVAEATLPTVSEPAAETAGSHSTVFPKPAGGSSRRSGSDPAGSSAELRRPKRGSVERGEKKSRTVARFITDGPGDPLVKLGEDGHLPELTLKEGRAHEVRTTQARQSNPAVLAIALCCSIGLTLLMLFMETGGFGDNTAQKAAARVEITEYYGTGNDDLKPYQFHLRRARQERARGDFDAEKIEYRHVLNQLRSEAKEKLYKYTGLTGRLDYADGDISKKSDRRLEELISILLSE